MLLLIPFSKEPLDKGERGEWKSWLKTQHSKNWDHVICSHRFMANRWGKVEKVTDFIFLGSKITADGDCSHGIKRCFAPWKKSFDQPRKHIKKQRQHLADKGPSSQSYDFSSSQVQRWQLDHKEGWAQKNWCFWIAVLEKTLESTCKETKPVNPKGNQSWIFVGRTDAEADTPILQPPDVKNWLIWKDPDAGKDWRQEEKGMIENEMVEWHHQLNGHEFE